MLHSRYGGSGRPVGRCYGGSGPWWGGSSTAQHLCIAVCVCVCPAPPNTFASPCVCVCVQHRPTPLQRRVCVCPAERLTMTGTILHDLTRTCAAKHARAVAIGGTP
eukprot:351760-Chlamydomonas_euryale.AAC.4